MGNPHLIVGLGNPGRDYARTRHNAGFMVLDELAGRWRVGWTNEKKFNARVAQMERSGSSLFLCQPQTFMNASGESVGPMAAYYQVPVERILIAVDDADLPLGSLRLRPGGSSGGHHGLESLERHLGTQEFLRLRLGIGRTGQGIREISGHVLSKFEPAETGLLEKVLQRACDQVECWLAAGLARAMNQFNGVIKIEENSK